MAHDIVSKQEKDLLLGYCPGSNGCLGRWLFPLMDIFNNNFELWTGEWNAALDHIYRRLAEDIARGRVKLCTRKSKGKVEMLDQKQWTQSTSSLLPFLTVRLQRCYGRCRVGRFRADLAQETAWWYCIPRTANGVIGNQKVGGFVVHHTPVRSYLSILSTPRCMSASYAHSLLCITLCFT